MTNKHVDIIKASGKVAEFSSEKLIRSLRNAGASEDIALPIADEISDRLHNGMTTKKIYRIAHSLLKDRSTHLAARYHLKTAIMELGPSGYPFEKYISEILSHQGYRVKVGEIVRGKCVNHEIDVIAEKENQHFMVECKYHNQKGTVSDVKIPLYIQARFKDVEAAWVNIPGHATKFHQGWVVTNTKFSTDAVQFGACCGLKLLGWDYPVNGGLKDTIDALGLYPLTCLNTLSKSEKIDLLQRKVVLCKELCDQPNLLKEIGLSEERVQKVLEEGNLLCKRLTAQIRL